MRYILIVLSLLTALTSTATEPAYWVLGSFKNPQNAETERARLGKEYAGVLITHVSHLDVFRVILPTTAGDREIFDLEVWRLTGPLKATMIEASINEKVQLTDTDLPFQDYPDDPPLNIPEPEPEPLYPVINADESIESYCQRLPTTRLCQHPKIYHAIEMDRKLSNHRANLRHSCDLVSDPERHNTCIGLYNR
jgi:hypothetical protein